MAQSRVYDLDVSVTASAQPDPGTSSASGDIVVYGTPVEQETLSGTRNGSNNAFTVAHTPRADWPFQLYRNGVKLILTTDYTRSGVNITMTSGNEPASDQLLTADYRY